MEITPSKQPRIVTIIKDDFQAEWQPIDTVTDDPEYKSYFGNLHYIQTLARNHPLMMRPGQQYRLQMSFHPDITLADD